MDISLLLKPFALKNKKCDELDKIQREYMYLFSLLEKVCNLYNIEIEEVETPSAFILKYMFLNGHCGLKKFEYDNKYHFGVGEFTGDLDADGYGTQYIVTLQNGHSEVGTIGEDVVVFRWDNLATPQITKISWFAEMLAETDLSMKLNIIYSRSLPIPIVETTNEENSLSKVMENLFNGKLTIFKRAQKRDYYGTGDTTKRETLDICNPQNSTYMSNLSLFHDKLITRMCLEFGVYVSSRDNKRAQLNDKELSAFEDYCAISSDDTYNQIKKSLEECEKVLGLKGTVTAKNYTHTDEDIVDEEDYIENVSRETSESEVEENETDRNLQNTEQE